MTTVYNFDQETGVFIGATAAHIDKLEGTPLLPAHATFDAPPAADPPFVAVREGGTWVVKEDHIGKTIWDTTTGDAMGLVEDYGPLPAGTTTTDPNPPEFYKAIEVRESRNALLSACDWTQVPDASVDQAAWATYRQALRDVPEQAGFPNSVVWPTQPGA